LFIFLPETKLITQTFSAMKKFLALGAICFIVLSGLYISSCKDKDKKVETKTGDKTDSATARLERGAYLFNHVMGCVDCHSKRDFTKYSGPPVPGTEGGGGFLFDEKLGLPGKIYGRNITPDNETGIGTWTDDDILKAITQGISKRGDTLFPIMPYVNFNHMAKEDLMSVIAYLRTLKPISNKIPDRQLMMPIAAVYPAPALQPSIESNRMPPPSDKVAYGAYLVNAADCGTCHTQMTEKGPDMSKQFAGGWTFDVGTFKVTSANITPDSTGIGAWTEQQFLNKFSPFREEKNYNFNPGKENTIMPLVVLAGMTDDDLKAIYAYLRTVKPVVNKVEKYPK
jgi:mono/diheme cytochrome c family protein